MTRTPDEIKKGLECCWGSRAKTGLVDCGQCPYWGKYGCPAGKVKLGNDALALIKQLEAQVPRWISVEERLPEERLCVSVYIQEDGGAYWIETAFRRDGKWRIQGEYVIDRNITHWMPLPKPPKEN